MAQSRPKLIPQLVPEPLPRFSANRLLRPSRWAAIRSDALAPAGNRCSVCLREQDKGLICHEVWLYDDEAGLATLLQLAILCPACNFVHHRIRQAKMHPPRRPKLDPPSIRFEPASRVAAHFRMAGSKKKEPGSWQRSSWSTGLPAAAGVGAASDRS